MAESLNHDENRLFAWALRPRSVYCAFEALVGEFAHELHNATCKEGRQKAKVVSAIQKRRLKQVNKKGMQKDRYDAPERHANRCLPDRSEMHLPEFAPDSPGGTKQKRQQPGQQPRDGDREQPPEPLCE